MHIDNDIYIGKKNYFSCFLEFIKQLYTSIAIRNIRIKNPHDAYVASPISNLLT